ncbi:hypothetical protein KL86DYS1_10544 [uncultured Dysgonomonas sp.]|uniref:Uncharacterized protein n=1 Tax=uncultured Dysgonomonas sp. TaxID=206096 RepID=A0A212IYK2_9BACT|nr:hypothetical protein KL86DYS1_10544 [uncultured Dysgonomonas sp.]
MGYSDNDHAWGTGLPHTGISGHDGIQCSQTERHSCSHAYLSERKPLDSTASKRDIVPKRVLPLVRHLSEIEDQDSLYAKAYLIDYLISFCILDGRRFRLQYKGYRYKSALHSFSVLNKIYIIFKIYLIIYILFSCFY